MHIGLNIILSNQNKSADRFCKQAAAQVPHMFCNFYLAKNPKCANISTTTEAGEKISTHRFVILQISEIVWAMLD